MNVKTLRSSKEEQENSAEIRIAKVGVAMFLLHMTAWTPYVVVVFMGVAQRL